MCLRGSEYLSVKVLECDKDIVNQSNDKFSYVSYVAVTVGHGICN